jgi:hypothetical protein
MDASTPPRPGSERLPLPVQMFFPLVPSRLPLLSLANSTQTGAVNLPRSSLIAEHNLLLGGSPRSQRVEIIQADFSGPRQPISIPARPVPMPKRTIARSQMMAQAAIYFLMINKFLGPQELTISLSQVLRNLAMGLHPPIARGNLRS